MRYLMIAAATIAASVTACSGSAPARSQDPHAAANARACAAVKAFKAHPDYSTFLPVRRIGKYAGSPIRDDVIRLAQAVFNSKPESQVRVAAQQLFRDCHL